MVMIENWRAISNKKTQSGCFFMDLSKAFDTLDHSLLFLKLNAYGFNDTAIH